MPWSREQTREPAVYNREALINYVPNQSVDMIHQEAEDKVRFNRMLKETKDIRKRDNKGFIMISNKPILKQRLVHLYVSGYYSTRQISSILCISVNTVLKSLKEPEVREMIQSYQDEEKDVIDTALRSLRLKAVETQAELLDSENDNVRADISKDILNRTGHAAPKQTNINVNHTYEERLASIINGVILETEFEEVIDDQSSVAQINTEGEVNSD